MNLDYLVNFLNTTFQVDQVRDFPNAINGLQLGNNGSVSNIVGAVDANRESIEIAIQSKADLLIVHHGLYWEGVQPIVGPIFDLFYKAIQANLAIYSLHLPLDIHPIYGHNKGIADALNLFVDESFACFMNQPCGLICHGSKDGNLHQKLQHLFPGSLHSLCFGRVPERIGIVAGSGGQEVLKEALEKNVDTLITGEVRYSAVSFAQLHKLNVYACGHYATESFGIKSLLSLIHSHSHLPCEFIDRFCEL